MRLLCVAIFAIAVLFASVNARPKFNRRHRSSTHERRTRSLEHYRDIQEPLESESEYEDEKALLRAAEIEEYERNRIHKKHMDYEHDTNAINQEYVPTYDQGYHQRRVNGDYENPKDNDFNDPFPSAQDRVDDWIPGVLPHDVLKDLDEVEENFAVDLDDDYQQRGDKYGFEHQDFDRNDIDSADDGDHSFDHPSYHGDYDTHMDDENDEEYDGDGYDDDEYDDDEFDDGFGEESEEESNESDDESNSSEDQDEQEETEQDEDKDDDDQQTDEEESQFGNDSPRQDNDEDDDDDDDDSQEGFDGTAVLNPRGNDGSTLSERSDYHKPSFLALHRLWRRLEELE